MAQATEELRVTADAQFWATIAEAGLLTVTIVFTAIAATAAVLAAKAAQASVNVATKMGQRQLRAYVTVSQVQLKTLNADGAIEAAALIKNTGQTPAYGLSAWYTIGLRPCPLVDSYFNEPTTINDKASITSIGAGDKISLEMRTKQTEAMAFVKRYIDDGVLAVVVYGEVRYHDTFGYDRHTTFRLYHDRGVNFPRLRKYKNGNTSD